MHRSPGRIEAGVLGVAPRRRFAAALLTFSIALGVFGPACASGTTAQDGAVHMSVTDSGFEPDHIKAKKGVPLKLVITRKSEHTCATDIVIDEYNIHAKLPLNTPVTIAFTPNKSGELRYGCAMNKMVSGTLTID